MCAIVPRPVDRERQRVLLPGARRDPTGKIPVFGLCQDPNRAANTCHAAAELVPYLNPTSCLWVIAGIGPICHAGQRTILDAIGLAAIDAGELDRCPRAEDVIITNKWTAGA